METIWVAVIAATSAIMGALVGTIPGYLSIRESRKESEWQKRQLAWQKKYEYLLDRRNQFDVAILAFEDMINFREDSYLSNKLLYFMDLKDLGPVFEEYSKLFISMMKNSDEPSNEQKTQLASLKAKILTRSLELIIELDSKIEQHIYEHPGNAI